jgi:DNA-binding transcriptional LysR family regulator
MSKLDLNLLIDLEALLAEGSVTGAAQRLSLSASAMSRRLSHLREALGDPLFVLAGRNLVPTERALLLRERVQAAVEDVRGIMAPSIIDFASLDRTLTLRANDGFVGAWAARLSASMAIDAPSVRLRFMPRADKGMEALRSGEVDLDLGVLSAPAPEIHSRSLLKARFVGVVRSGHPLSRKRRVDVAQFVKWPHVSASRRGYVQGPIDTALAAEGRQRHVAMVVPGFQAAITMAQNSDFIATMPEAFGRWAKEQQPLHLFALPVMTPMVDISMSWHPRHHADPVHRWLREHVRNATQ